MQRIADEIGVSRTTVSLVLKGEGQRYRIAEATQDRILEQVRKTGFKANYFASALNRKRTGTIGLVFPDLFEDFMSQVLRGIEDVILNTEFIPMICSCRFRADRETQQIEELLHRGVEGLIVAPTAEFRGTSRPLDLFSRLLEEHYPLVFLDRYPAGMEANIVLQDDAGGGWLAAASLMDVGCQSFGYVGLDLEVTSLSARRGGYRAGLQDAGFSLSEEDTILLGELNPEAGDLEAALSRWHRQDRLPDGLFVSTSGLALRCRSLLAQWGVVPGRDIHIVRFGASDTSAPGPIHGIRQPHQEMGRAAAERLLQLIEGDPTGSPTSVTVPVEIDPTQE